MSPSPTNSGATGPYAGDGSPSSGIPSNVVMPTKCPTASMLPNQPYLPYVPNTPFNGPIRTPSPPPASPSLKPPETVKPPPAPGGYTPSYTTIDPGNQTIDPKTGAPVDIPERRLALMSLSQSGVPMNSNTNPLFRLNYGNALGLGVTGDQRDPLPLYNPFQGANR